MGVELDSTEFYILTGRLIYAHVLMVVGDRLDKSAELAKAAKPLCALQSPRDVLSGLDGYLLNGLSIRLKSSSTHWNGMLNYSPIWKLRGREIQ